jgi:hypothetical protein
MPALATAVKRLLQNPLRRTPRAAEAYFQILATEPQLTRSAFLLAHHGGGLPAEVQRRLSKLWDLGSTGLYIQASDAWPAADIVVSRHSGQRIVAMGRGFRVETETHEPAPDGAYLTERQYRQLGFYERPPAERAVVALRVSGGSDRACFVDVPHYVAHVTLVVNGRLLADAVPIPHHGKLLYAMCDVADPAWWNG